MALSGIQFKEKYPGSALLRNGVPQDETSSKFYYKWLHPDLTHQGFTYQLGLNIDIHPFTERDLSPGGLHFIRKSKHIPLYYNYGSRLGIIEIPDDAQVYCWDREFKADKFVLSLIITDEAELLEIMKQYVDECSWSKKRSWRNMCHDAAGNGHFEILKWARENGGSFDVYTTAYGRVRDENILKWLLENGCPSNSNTFAFAARNGQLEILKWAQEKGYLTNVDMCYWAAEGSKLEVLKWARENGYQWSANVLYVARIYGHSDVLKWALENGCPNVNK